MGNSEFRGIFPYLVTPSDEKGRIKEQVLADLVDHLIRKGVHGLTRALRGGRTAEKTMAPQRRFPALFSVGMRQGGAGNAGVPRRSAPAAAEAAGC